MSRALSDRLVGDIERHIATLQLPAGTRLPERGLAEHFRVSRSPIREALRKLAEQGVVNPGGEGGYVVSECDGARPMPQPQEGETDNTEAIYLCLAEDRLAGALPDRVTESELMRRYGATRGQLAGILRRMVHEGWVERLPGHGWAFLSVLNSAAAYEHSYRFRFLLEPAAILEAGYRVDEAALRRCQAEQQRLLDGAIKIASPAQLFDANTRLHETIAGFSGNPFIVDSLRRLNGVRRLMEYRKAVDRAQSERRCREHLALIDLLLAGDREAAADYLRLHLRNALRDKTPS
jgi:DNA-binding GntR family transcriptional regulator